MKIEDKLYLKENKRIQKYVSLDDDLYDKIKKLSDNKFDANISEIINVCIEDYIDKNNPTYYPKKDNVLSTNRSVIIRKNNVEGLNNFHKKTGISFTRLLNSAINEFLISHKL